VCNEWNELQTVRLTNPEFTLMVLLLLLYGCQLESLGAFTPNSEQLDTTQYTPQSVLLRFALASTFYLAIAAAQVRASPRKALGSIREGLVLVCLCGRTHPCQADSAVAKASKTKELRKRHGAKREFTTSVWAFDTRG